MDMMRYIQELHYRISDSVRKAITIQSVKNNTRVIAEGKGDVTYQIDAIAEKIIDSYFLSAPPEGGAVVICEGLGVRIYPRNLTSDKVKWRIIIDPLDGTREIMYDKRSCWILTGVALNRGENTCLSDIILSIQTEIPPSIQTNSIVLTAELGKGTWCSIMDVSTRKMLTDPFRLQPSQAHDLRHGFSVFVNFFPGMKEAISRLEEKILTEHLGRVEHNSALTFTDQYLSTAGQIYFLASGKYRLVADFRAYLGKLMQDNDKEFSLCCHPYDLSTWLILAEAGGIISEIDGKKLSYPLDTETNCSWLGYANSMIASKLDPIIQKELLKLTSKLKLEKKASEFGITQRANEMSTGEYRYHWSMNDGSGFICSIASSEGLWQNAHYHKYAREIIVVQAGVVGYITKSYDTPSVVLYHKDESFTVEPFMHHNIYMFPNSMTNTIKFSVNEDEDWYPDSELDVWCKAHTPNKIDNQVNKSPANR